MKNLALKIENLGKKYFIGQGPENNGYITLREKIYRSTSSFFKNVSDVFKGNPIIVGNKIEEFWALKNINFEIKEGEVVGIIGRNGSGKSTLLKLLSRITTPTTGKINLYGRAASLLEVGTGFHPELTGRENIYLNGSILGESMKEINKKFDAIVDFAGVEKFLDTPVKRYSSGMYVRLAFAIPAHLEPDILIIDEVLAVGDMDFQKKCIEKMESSTKEGRTVLFVSHNLPLVSTFCKKSILLERGKKIKEGITSEVLSFYQKGANVNPGIFDFNLNGKKCGDDNIILKKAWIQDKKNLIKTEFYFHDDIKIFLTFEIFKKLNKFPVPIFEIFDEGNVCILSTPLILKKDREAKPGTFTTSCIIPKNFLNNGYFYIDIMLNYYNSEVTAWHEEKALSFRVIDKFDDRHFTKLSSPGLIRPQLNWTLHD